MTIYFSSELQVNSSVQERVGDYEYHCLKNYNYQRRKSIMILVALIFFQASLFQLLKLEIHCEDHISPS